MAINALDAVYTAYPFLQQLGIGPQLSQWIIQGNDASTIVNLVRQTSQYQAMFPSIRRQDGTLRMSESQYLQTQDQYRTLVFNYTGTSLTSPTDFAAIFDGDVSPNELDQRLKVWDTVQRDGGDLRAAFYVYADMRLSDEDLYKYVVDPGARADFDSKYTTKAATTKLTYETWITRATEVGLQNVTTALIDLRNRGVDTDAAVQQVQDMNPEQARQIADLLYHGGNPQGGNYLGLNQLQRAFEFAMIGSAATDQGLALPSQDRIEAIRQAGIDRTKALESYGTFTANQNLLQGMVQRAGGGGFGQNEWEQAQLLHQGDTQALLAKAQAQESALGKAQSGANFGTDKSGRVKQTGLGAPY